MGFICYNSVMEKNIIAFWGYPRKELIEKTKVCHKDALWVDLDIDFGYPDCKFTPDNYCAIIKNILNNAFYLKDRIIKILAPIGKDKCDSAYFISKILSDEGFEVLESVFEDKCTDLASVKTPVSDSALPLKRKVEIITANIIEQRDYTNLEKVEPAFGFWGVPPNDLSVLELFPDNTRVYGWIRAVEAGYPGDYNLETYVDEGVPVVFFSQAFCSKTNLAKYLANKHQGLFIDVDGFATNSIRAKIEAFLKLR